MDISIFSLKELLEHSPQLEKHNTLEVWGKLAEYCADYTLLAGGAMTFLLTNKKHESDFDIFFRSKDGYDFLDKNLEALECKVLIETANAKTYLFQGYPVQLIKRRWYNTVNDIFEDFDFTISMFGIDRNMTIYTSQFSFWDLANKEIRIQHVNNLGSTFKRVIKYGKKGYHVPKETYIKLMKLFTINNDLENIINNAVLTPEQEAGIVLTAEQAIANYQRNEGAINEEGIPF